ncbi:MAG TPA: aminodeoxychorismate lyase, partial [Acidocella sp.]|nr:aminodeoxychorismate lyase [Acidocella sp.]
MRSLKNRIVLLLVTLLVTVRLGHMAVNQSFYGPGPLQISRALVVPPGSTGNVAAVLHQDGVITYPLVFRAAAWVTR